jgi:hypothetical protein
MPSFFHYPDNIFFNELRNDLRLLKGELSDVAFVKPDVQPDADRDGKDENQTGDENDFEE